MIDFNYLLIIIKRQVIKNASLLSYFINVNLLFGEQVETVSARCYREGVIDGKDSWLKAAKALDVIFWFDNHHCFNSYLAEKRRAERYYKKG